MSSYEDETRSSHEIATKYRDRIRDNDSDESLAAVHFRGGEEEFLLGKEWCASGDPDTRATGAHILAQLGWGDKHFFEESVEILIPLLDDPDPFVICCAAFALGHRNAESAIPALMKNVEHPDVDVRRGVVSGLSCLENKLAIEGLIHLATDEDHEVRNWAVFGLGSLNELDTPELREALRRNLSDPDGEIRGEALVGLARRKDTSIVPNLLEEWQGELIGRLSLEAAEQLGDCRLFEALKRLEADLEVDDEPHFASTLTKAIAACAPKS